MTSFMMKDTKEIFVIRLIKEMNNMQFYAVKGLYQFGKRYMKEILND